MSLRPRFVSWNAAVRLGLCLFSLIPAAHAAVYYVSGTGMDTNAGTGTDNNSAFLTLAKGASVLAPGDTLYVMNGTYTNAPGNGLMRVTVRGSDAAWTTITAYPGHRPLLKSTDWSAIDLNRAAYVIIDGLTLEGTVYDTGMTVEAATTAAESAPIPQFNGNGIVADGRDAATFASTVDVTLMPRNLIIRNNTVRGFAGGGISCIQADYVTIENNIVQDCAWYSVFANSGISIWQARNADTSTADYRIKILGNRVFGNKSQMIWSATQSVSDGNGIIIDDGRNTQNDSTLGAYTGKTLVANNLVVNNGGSGIHTYRSDNVDIVHNTAYFNGQVLDWGEIFASESGTIRIYNNICYARPDRVINKLSQSSTNLDYRSNIYFGGYANAAYYTANNTTADPLFLNAALDLATADFGVSSTSPALDVALTTYNSVTLSWVATLTNDITGGIRTRNSVTDIGAYERIGRAIPTTGLVVTGLGEAILAGDPTAAAVNDTSFPATEINQPAANVPLHTFTLLNRDNSSITLSSLSLGGSSAFTLVNAPVLPLVLAPSASVTFQVRFLPTAAGTQSGTVSLVHSSPGTTSPFTFALSGTATQIPTVGLSATSLSATLPVTTSATHNGFVLTNRGSASLTWNAALPKLYTFADSLSPTGPAYSWVDISATGNAVSFGTNIFDNAFSSALSLGFTFPYFGTGYTQLCIDINGHVSFDLSKAGNTNSRYRVPSTLASMLATNNGLIPKSIAVFFDDLLLISGTSSVRYQQTDANTFVVSWINVTFKADSGKAANLQRKLNFQVILKRDGTITTQYQGVTNTDGNYLIGIVNNLPTTGVNDSKQYVQYAYTANAVNSGLAVRFTPPPRAFDGTTNFAPGGSTYSWANFTGSTSGTLAPGSSQTIPLAFNSTGLVSGLSYATNLTLTTNDTANSTLYIPVSLTVGGTANLSPSVSLTQPYRNLTVQGAGSPITLAASATDPEGSITQVEFYDGATLLATDTSSPYTYTWTSSIVGTHTITAKITDNRGVTVTSQGYVITVVNLPPVVAVTTPTATSTATLGVPFTLTANAADADAGSITKVEFYVNSILAGTATTAPYTAAWTPQIISPATVYAKAYDNNGASTISSSVTFSVVRPDLPNSGLLAYWRFNESTGLTTAADLSGNSRSATLADANTTFTASGKFANALAFNGANNAKASFGHGAITTAFSLSAWVKADATPTGTLYPRIISLQGGPSLFLVRNFSTDANFTGGLGFNDGTGGDWRSSGSVIAGAWQHVVITFDLSRNDTAPVFYLNGSLTGTYPVSNMSRTGTLPVVNATTTTALSLLGNRLDLQRPLTGVLDQVRLYDRVLTPAEVTALYLDDGGPLAPASLTATPSASGVALAWATITSTNATVTYQVARSLFSNGPFTPLASSLTATFFNDTTTIPGTTYYYTVSATAAGDNGPTVTSATVTTWTALQSWRNATFGTIAATGNAADLADPDGDGISNLLEYALGLSPTTATPSGLPTSTVDSNGKLTLTFLRACSEVTYTVQGSSDLATWSDIAINPGTVSTSVTVTDKPPIGATKRFLRLKVTAP
ncbi:MAG: right-handed parallel beta-helix repeat-containing protein [Opitutus sp.]|nr:right-handed parallel beta-helix repeat-containing protein [Opitutus sp.]MCS6272752.1 right-handed parallel beta-helix repeat-containing protein [Opitutus sp.]MCS6276384.1 right-handed parallel beta-helix repeat-containing protein [Opitutus sp.]MCS6301968.1 right-handed parallel beta-helix repeat-containing protein [Opitutus sp.]